MSQMNVRTGKPLSFSIVDADVCLGQGERLGGSVRLVRDTRSRLQAAIVRDCVGPQAALLQPTASARMWTR